jgi:thioredoxin 1
MKIETEHLEKEKDLELEKIHAKKMKELATKMKGKESPQNAPMTLDDTRFDETVQQQQLMLIDCWADWCGPCRMIAPTVEEIAREYAGRVSVAKLNVDESPETASRFGIVSIPTLLIMKEGKEVDRIIGAVPKNYIEEKLKKYL